MQFIFQKKDSKIQSQLDFVYLFVIPLEECWSSMVGEMYFLYTQSRKSLGFLCLQIYQFIGSSQTCVVLDIY